MFAHAFTTVVALLLAAAIAYAIMSHRVRDGVVMKVGLIFMFTGLLGVGLADPNAPRVATTLLYGHAIVYAGLLICVYGYLRRVRKTARKEPRRRVSDWSELHNQDGSPHANV